MNQIDHLPKPVNISSESLPAVSIKSAEVKPSELDIKTTSAPIKNLPETTKADFEEVQRQLTDIVANLNKVMESNKRSLGFGFDEKLGIQVITVRNANTGEVVRQIPSDAILKVAHTFDALKGMLHDASI